MLSDMPELEPEMQNFGASDCGCSTHLFYTPLAPALADFDARLQLVDAGATNHIACVNATQAGGLAT